MRILKVSFKQWLWRGNYCSDERKVTEFLRIEVTQESRRPEVKQTWKFIISTRCGMEEHWFMLFGSSWSWCVDGAVWGRGSKDCGCCDEGNGYWMRFLCLTCFPAGYFRQQYLWYTVSVCWIGVRRPAAWETVPSKWSKVRVCVMSVLFELSTWCQHCSVMRL